MIKVEPPVGTLGHQHNTRDTPPDTRDTPPDTRDTLPDTRDTPPDTRDTPPNTRNTATDTLYTRTYTGTKLHGPLYTGESTPYTRIHQRDTL